MHGTTRESTAGRSGPKRQLGGDILAWAIGFAVAGGALFDGYFRFGVWGSIALVVGVIALGALVVVRDVPGPVAFLPAAALAFVACIQFASAIWAESSGQALLEAQRWTLYVVGLGLLLLVANTRTRRVWLLAGIGSGVVITAAYEVIRLLGGNLEQDFVLGRLAEPIGYVNGLASILLVGFWPLIGLAEAGGRRLGSLGVAGATALLLLAGLVQSRGASVALGISALLLMAVLPGRLYRATAIAVPALALAATWSSFGAVYDSAPQATGIPARAEVDDALAVIGIATVASGLLWLLIQPAVARLASLGPRLAARAGRQAIAVAAVIAALVGVAVAPALVREVEQGWDDFRSLERVQPGSRASTGGNRYDLWRVAVDQFRDSPLGGIGAGNYDTTYYAERRTTENVRQPHSLVFQTAGETGLLGLSALLLFLAAAYLPVARVRSVALRTDSDRGVLVAALGCGTFVVLHSFVDWVFLIPSVMGCALISFAALAGLASWPPQWRAPPMRIRPIVFVLITLALANLGTMQLSLLARYESQRSLASDPGHAVSRALRSIRLDDRTLENYYALAAAQARLDDYAQARETLREAARREPSDYVPHALLGDLASRRGDTRAAAADYRRALELNPKDEALRQLVTGVSRAGGP
ncbi:MAG TPA: O-antigen ligase family protein [Thermoleophilaceae bacterium]|nr:O-antigen ligase family protein [Thermoleophilaceae bacterium]